MKKLIDFQISTFDVIAVITIIATAISAVWSLLSGLDGEGWHGHLWIYVVYLYPVAFIINTAYIKIANTYYKYLYYEDSTASCMIVSPIIPIYNIVISAFIIVSTLITTTLYLPIIGLKSFGRGYLNFIINNIIAPKNAQRQADFHKRLKNFINR